MQLAPTPPENPPVKLAPSKAGLARKVWPFYAGCIALVALGWFCLIAVTDNHRAGPGDGEIWIGLILGTLFGQTSAVAFWTAFGPARFMVRLPTSFVALISLLVALALSPIGRDDAKALTVIGLPIAGLWIAAQIPLWGTRWLFGVALRHPSQFAAEDASQAAQFGLRQLMLFTLVIGIALGLGRIIVPRLSLAEVIDRETPIFLFLTLVAILQSLPLTFAVLLPRWATVAALAILTLIALATATELPLFERFGASGPNVWHLIWINVFTVAWVLAFAVVARLCGYRLLQQPRAVT